MAALVQRWQQCDCPRWLWVAAGWVSTDTAVAIGSAVGDSNSWRRRKSEKAPVAAGESKFTQYLLHRQLSGVHGRDGDRREKQSNSTAQQQWRQRDNRHRDESYGSGNRPAAQRSTAQGD